jgi:hypothetical protein
MRGRRPRTTGPSHSRERALAGEATKQWEAFTRELKNGRFDLV